VGLKGFPVDVFYLMTPLVDFLVEDKWELFWTNFNPGYFYVFFG
jgi:hypothetical protein